MPLDAAAGDDTDGFGELFFEKYASAPIAAAATTNTAIIPELIQATPKAMSVAIPNTINLFVFIRFTGPYLRFKFAAETNCDLVNLLIIWNLLLFLAENSSA